MRRQGSQFTSTGFIKVLAGAEIKISMGGKGAWRDNVFVRRLWKNPRSGPVQPAFAGSGGSIIKAEIHLRNAPNLFRQTEPPLPTVCLRGNSTVANLRVKLCQLACRATTGPHKRPPLLTHRRFPHKLLYNFP